MVAFAGVWDLGLEGTNYIDRFFMALINSFGMLCPYKIVRTRLVVLGLFS